jgi:hypothetical protein
VLERFDEAFHLAFLPDREAHVIWKSWEQPADVNLAAVRSIDLLDGRVPSSSAVALGSIHVEGQQQAEPKRKQSQEKSASPKWQ